MRCGCCRRGRLLALALGALLLAQGTAVPATAAERNREREAGATLNRLGRAYRLDEPRRALALYREAQRINHRLGERSEEALSWNDLGKTQQALGETGKALEAYEQALALYRTLGKRREEGVVLGNLGRLHRDLGQLQKALEELWRSLLLLRGSPDEAAAMTDFGFVLGRIHQDRRGIPWLQGALVLARQAGDRHGEATTLNDLAKVYSFVGEREAARRSYEEALAAYRTLGEKTYAACTEINLAQLDLELGRPAAAVARLNRAIPVLTAAGDRDDEANARLTEVRARRLLDDLPRARTAMTVALERIESLRREPASHASRADFLASRQEFYRLNVELWMAQDRRQPGAGFAERAFAASEEGKARSLLDLLAESGVDLRRGVPPSLLAEEAELGRQVNAADSERHRLPEGEEEGAPAARLARLSIIDREITGLLDRYDRAQARIRQASPGLAALSLPRPLDARQSARLLDRDTLLLEYALGDERSFLWVLSAAGLAASLQLPARNEIEDAARRAAGLLPRSRETLARTETDLALADLSRLLLGPAAPWLAGKRLAIVADGALHSIPFAALPDPADPSGRTPLLAGHEVVSLPSASALAAQRRKLGGRRPAPGTVAVVADPVFDAADPRVAKTRPDQAPRPFAPLPYSRNEAREILSLVPPAARFSAQGFAASRETVLSGKLSAYRIVHFATHAVPDSEHPELYEIVLSFFDPQGRPLDGYLRAHEIYRLHLPAELVVLSACRTALGREVRGEGLLGLTRAFQYAGARRVLVSLWQVDDRATAELMRRFYQGLLVRHLSPSAALRKAQNDLRHLEGWESPYYWAGFILSGD
jgi:CHAT domain-containing protein